MKILHINSYYSVSEFYKHLYDRQVKGGLDINVFVPVSSSYEEKKIDYGPYTRVSKDHKKYDRLAFHLKHNKIYKDIQDQYNIRDYSMIHAHSLFSNGYIAARLKKEYGIPYIVAVRDTDVNIFFEKMIHLRKLGINIIEEASQIIFLSKTLRKYTIEKYIPKHLQKKIYDKTLIIPNGLDDFWLKNTPSSSKEEPKKIKLRLLQVGEISRRKNITASVKATEILIQKGYKVKLDVVGKIKDQQIFDKIKDLDYVNYLGYRSKEELIEIYRQNDIFVLPSRTETFGLVYPEAMSQGLPVIYTRGQGFDKQFPDGEVGFAVDCLNANDIAEKVIEIVNDYQKISNNCIKNCFKFDWTIIEKTYKDIYQKV